MAERSSEALQPAHPPESAIPSMPLGVTVAAWAAILTVALTSLYFFYTHGFSNLYGDGIAHMEGARRLTDSRTPGYEEIGTVWLPLFHIVVAPLAASDFLWRTGLGGSFVSTLAFACTAWFIFRLAWEMNRTLSSAALALAGFLFCPNMLYLASTPLTEPLALLWAVLAVYGLFRNQRSGRIRPLIGSALAAFLGTLTRYDEWYVLPFAALFVLLARKESWPERIRHAGLFAAVAGVGPVLWIAHNAYRFGNPLEFYNGPFSAQAIYAHQLATTAFPYPTDGSLVVAARYYLSDLKLVLGFWPVILSAFGLVIWALDRRDRARRSSALLLLAPLPFYVHALAYAAVPLYVPNLLPYAYYNTRYGIEMLAASALFSSFWLGRQLPSKARHALLTVLLGILITQAATTMFRGASQLTVLREGVLNTPCKSRRQSTVIEFLKSRYDRAAVLIALGKWPCVMPEVGISFRQTLTEANREEWRRMWSEPGKLVKWIVRGDGDSVDELMRAHPQAFKGFDLLLQETIPREGGVAIYRRHL